MGTSAVFLLNGALVVYRIRIFRPPFSAAVVPLVEALYIIWDANSLKISCSPAGSWVSRAAQRFRRHDGVAPPPRYPRPLGDVPVAGTPPQCPSGAAFFRKDSVPRIVNSPLHSDNKGRYRRSTSKQSLAMVGPAP